MLIKKGDTVIVLSGKDKGKTGKVLKTHPTENTVVVEKINMVTKHAKAQGPQKPGGIQNFEAPIHVSKVAYYDAKSKKGSRLGVKIEGDKKRRVIKKTGQVID